MESINIQINEQANAIFRFNKNTHCRCGSNWNANEMPKKCQNQQQIQGSK